MFNFFKRVRLITPPTVKRKLIQVSRHPLVMPRGEAMPVITRGVVRYGMTRIVFEDGTTTRWHVMAGGRRRPRAKAVELCGIDEDGNVHYSQLRIG